MSGFDFLATVEISYLRLKRCGKGLSDVMSLQVFGHILLPRGKRGVRSVFVLSSSILDFLLLLPCDGLAFFLHLFAFPG